MVIFAAVGGKRSLLGAAYGALLVNTAKSLFSENFPQLWLYCMGGLFIFVVVLMPNGLAGLWNDYGKAWFATIRKRVAEKTVLREADTVAPIP